MSEILPPFLSSRRGWGAGRGRRGRDFLTSAAPCQCGEVFQACGLYQGEEHFSGGQQISLWVLQWSTPHFWFQCPIIQLCGCPGAPGSCLSTNHMLLHAQPQESLGFLYFLRKPYSPRIDERHSRLQSLQVQLTLASPVNLLPLSEISGPETVHNSTS